MSIKIDTQDAWTKQFIEEAIFESGTDLGDQKLYQIAKMFSRSEIHLVDPSLTYRFIDAVIQRDIVINRRVCRAFTRVLRHFDAFGLLNASVLVDRNGGCSVVNKILFNLTFPRIGTWVHDRLQLNVSSELIQQIVTYMYTESFEPSLCIKDLLSLRVIAIMSHNDSLRDQVFSAIHEALQHQKDSVEERCTLIGLCYRERPGQLFQSQTFSKSGMVFLEELSSLNPEFNRIHGIDAQSLPEIFSAEEWGKILHTLTNLPGYYDGQLISLGPIKPLYLLPSFMNRYSFEAATFRAILYTDSAPLVIRLSTMQDFYDWAVLCLNSISLSDGYLFPNFEKGLLTVRVQEIEVDAPLAEALSKLYGVGRGLKYVVPHPPQTRVIEGLTPFPGYMPFPHR